MEKNEGDPLESRYKYTLKISTQQGFCPAARRKRSGLKRWQCPDCWAKAEKECGGLDQNCAPADSDALPVYASMLPIYQVKSPIYQFCLIFGLY